MSFLIDTDGSVVEKNVVKSSGFPELDRATLEGMARCQFTPALTNGKPEQSLLSFSYTWTLN
jgi:protein TonB